MSCSAVGSAQRSRLVREHGETHYRCRLVAVPLERMVEKLDRRQQCQRWERRYRYGDTLGSVAAATFAHGARQIPNTLAFAARDLG
ncbi:hypothetical protein UA74_05050 [Actinoalloteichus fjordicus]|uniref:Uncharacterized protein n=1 Tax=Actinoalloteichus fjordicus TaxID=1612552 RepID=A0AAC9PQR6_9PSEU|nr:hypothetical protein UA74_05050 [Actinoalloteichus fjordicus]